MKNVLRKVDDETLTCCRLEVLHTFGTLKSVRTLRSAKWMDYKSDGRIWMVREEEDVVLAAFLEGIKIFL